MFAYVVRYATGSIIQIDIEDITGGNIGSFVSADFASIAQATTPAIPKIALVETPAASGRFVVTNPGNIFIFGHTYQITTFEVSGSSLTPIGIERLWWDGVEMLPGSPTAITVGPITPTQASASPSSGTA